MSARAGSSSGPPSHQVETQNPRINLWRHARYALCLSHGVDLIENLLRARPPGPPHHAPGLHWLINSLPFFGFKKLGSCSVRRRPCALQHLLLPCTAARQQLHHLNTVMTHDTVLISCSHVIKQGGGEKTKEYRSDRGPGGANGKYQRLYYRLISILVTM